VLTRNGSSATIAVGMDRLVGGRLARTVPLAAADPAAENLPSGGRLLLAVDDTPTKRYGPKVQGAGIHHNPTRGLRGCRL
jgi:hypothetical protein